MLWSRPIRAQPPIVDVVKCTFAAARMACASDNVIQSAADGIGQSESRAGVFAAVPDVDGFVSADGRPLEAAAGTAGADSLSEPDDPDSLAGPASVVPSSPPREPEPVLTAARRSFFAQPEPLKCTDGAVMAFRTGPSPHSGQDAGGSPWTPWITSKRRPQAAHT
jgi:hypothetical protein